MIRFNSSYKASKVAPGKSQKLSFGGNFIFNAKKIPFYLWSFVGLAFYNALFKFSIIRLGTDQKDFVTERQGFLDLQ